MQETLLRFWCWKRWTWPQLVSSYGVIICLAPVVCVLLSHMAAFWHGAVVLASLLMPYIWDVMLALSLGFAVFAAYIVCSWGRVWAGACVAAVTLTGIIAIFASYNLETLRLVGAQVLLVAPWCGCGILIVVRPDAHVEQWHSAHRRHASEQAYITFIMVSCAHRWPTLHVHQSCQPATSIRLDTSRLTLCAGTEQPCNIVRCHTLQWPLRTADAAVVQAWWHARMRASAQKLRADDLESKLKQVTMTADLRKRDLTNLKLAVRNVAL